MAIVERGVDGGVAAPVPRVPPLDHLRAALEDERDRWFLWVPVLLSAGILVYFALPREPAFAAATLVAPAVMVLFLALARGTLSTVLLGALLMAAAGFSLAKMRTEAVRAPVLAKPTGHVEVRGWVELVEPRATRGQRLTLRVISIAGLEAAKTPYRVRVRTMSALSGVKPGDAVRVKASLAPPSPPVLPESYDFARQSWFQRLGGVGFSMTKPEFDTDAGPPPVTLAWRAEIERLRQAIGARIIAALPGETGHIAQALITGERGGIGEATNDAWRDSGLIHILSISGLHMAIMGGAIFASVRFLLAAVPAIALRYPVKKWAAAAALLGTLGYLLISGAAFATLRSYLMISVMFVSILMDRPAIALRNVALAAAITLLIWPESINDVGFQMSFAAVVALTAAYEAVRERWSRRGYRPGAVMRVLLFFGGIVLSTLVASLAVAPFAAYHFHKSQQFAVLANLVATPVCNLLVMPAALATLVAMPLGLEVWPLTLMGWGIEAMDWCARWVAGLPGAVALVPAMPAAAFALMVAGGLWLLLVRARVRFLGFVSLAAGLALAPTLQRPDVLIGRDGRLVAVRGADGLLSAVEARQAGFVLARWLEHDGDGRAVKQVQAASAFRCDPSGCVARVKGMTVAAVAHPAALADDCARADLVAAPFALGETCTRPRVVVDFFAARQQGSHAVYIEEERRSPLAAMRARPRASPTGQAQDQDASDGAQGTPPRRPMVRVETVASARGDRPWAALPAAYDPAAVAPGAAAGRRIGSFAAPGLAGGGLRDADERAAEDEADLDPGELPPDGMEE